MSTRASAARCCGVSLQRDPVVGVLRRPVAPVRDGLHHALQPAPGQDGEAAAEVDRPVGLGPEPELAAVPGPQVAGFQLRRPLLGGVDLLGCHHAQDLLGHGPQLLRRRVLRRSEDELFGLLALLTVQPDRQRVQRLADGLGLAHTDPAGCGRVPDRGSSFQSPRGPHDPGRFAGCLLTRAGHPVLEPGVPGPHARPGLVSLRDQHRGQRRSPDDPGPGSRRPRPTGPRRTPSSDPSPGSRPAAYGSARSSRTQPYAPPEWWSRLLP